MPCAGESPVVVTWILEVQSSSECTAVCVNFILRFLLPSKVHELSSALHIALADPEMVTRFISAVNTVCIPPHEKARFVCGVIHLHCRSFEEPPSVHFGTECSVLKGVVRYSCSTNPSCTSHTLQPQIFLISHSFYSCMHTRACLLLARATSD